MCVVSVMYATQLTLLLRRLGGKSATVSYFQFGRIAGIPTAAGRAHPACASGVYFVFRSRFSNGRREFRRLLTVRQLNSSQKSTVPNAKRKPHIISTLTSDYLLLHNIIIR